MPGPPLLVLISGYSTPATPVSVSRLSGLVPFHRRLR